MSRYKISLFIIPLLVIGLNAQSESFPHQLHIEDVELACDECHDNVAESASLESRLIPDGEICADCHGESMPFTVRPVLTEAFSHKYHISKTFECSNCHGAITGDDADGPSKIWSESDCQACHSTHPPSSHTLEWSSVHGLEVISSTEKNCRTCHGQKFCDMCHQLQQFTPVVHSVDYILSHSFDAKSGMLECSSCHDIVADCYSCHSENQIMPMNHNFLDWVGFQFDAGGLHSTAALEEPDLCHTCHIPASDATCLKCH
jgi:hypothetical protein